MDFVEALTKVAEESRRDQLKRHAATLAGGAIGTTGLAAGMETVREARSLPRVYRWLRDASEESLRDFGYSTTHGPLRNFATHAGRVVTSFAKDVPALAAAGSAGAVGAAALHHALDKRKQAADEKESDLKRAARLSAEAGGAYSLWTGLPAAWEEARKFYHFGAAHPSAPPFVQRMAGEMPEDIAVSVKHRTHILALQELLDQRAKPIIEQAAKTRGTTYKEELERATRNVYERIRSQPFADIAGYHAAASNGADPLGAFTKAFDQVGTHGGKSIDKLVEEADNLRRAAGEGTVRTRALDQLGREVFQQAPRKILGEAAKGFGTAAAITGVGALGYAGARKLLDMAKRRREA